MDFKFINNVYIVHLNVHLYIVLDLECQFHDSLEEGLGNVFCKKLSNKYKLYHCYTIPAVVHL